MSLRTKGRWPATVLWRTLVMLGTHTQWSELPQRKEKTQTFKKYTLLSWAQWNVTEGKGCQRVLSILMQHDITPFCVQAAQPYGLFKERCRLFRLGCTDGGRNEGGSRSCHSVTCQTHKDWGRNHSLVDAHCSWIGKRLPALYEVQCINGKSS